VQVFDRRTVQVLFTTVVCALLLLFIYSAWRALIAFLFAIFFAYLLEAPVSRLQSWLRGSRTAAIAVVYLIFIAALVLVIALVGPPVFQEAQKLTQQAPDLAQKITSGEYATQLGVRHGWSQETMARIQGFLNDHKTEMLEDVQAFLFRAVRTAQNMWWLLLVPILAIFFLKDGDRFGQIIINSVENARYREIVAATVEKMNSMLGHFIRAQLTLALLAMVVITFVLWAMHVPYGFALGPAAGALEFIPVVGPIIGGIAIVVVAALSGYGHVFWLVVFLLVWRVVQDYVSSPRILGGTLELHPLAVLFGVFAGGEVAGVIGVFLSIPVLASLRIFWHTWQMYRRSPERITTSSFESR